MTRILLLGGDGFVGRSFRKHQTSFGRIAVVCRGDGADDDADLTVKNPADIPLELFGNADVVINCFGLAHQKEQGRESLYYAVNRDLALDLARKSKEMGVKTFVQISSIAVYGNACDIDYRTPIQPVTHYGRSKAEADQRLLAMETETFNVLLIRPPMLYGSAAPGNMARLIQLVSKIKYLPFANADEKRESLCIHNFVFQLEHAIIHHLRGILLLRDLKIFSTRELVEIIAGELSLKRKLFAVPHKTLARVAPGYCRKLYGRLRIHADFQDGDGRIPADPEKILRLMVRAASDKEGVNL